MPLRRILCTKSEGATGARAIPATQNNDRNTVNDPFGHRLH